MKTDEKKATVKDGKPYSYKFRKGRRERLYKICKKRSMHLSELLDRIVDEFLEKEEKKINRKNKADLAA